MTRIPSQNKRKYLKKFKRQLRMLLLPLIHQMMLRVKEQSKKQKCKRSNKFKIQKRKSWHQSRIQKRKNLSQSKKLRLRSLHQYKILKLRNLNLIKILEYKNLNSQKDQKALFHLQKQQLCVMEWLLQSLQLDGIMVLLEMTKGEILDNASQ